jgi:C-terminal processing protease CtpA/Prc
MLRAPRGTIAVVAAALVALTVARPFGQSLALDRQRGEMMLDTMAHDLHEQYYDPTFHGVDLDAHIATAKQRVRAANSIGEIFGIVAQVAVDLDDSHTRFLPPARATVVEYGWSTRCVGDVAYVNVVDDASDAARQGLRLGDRVLQIAGFTASRQNERLIWYLLLGLRPQPSVRVVVQSPGGQPRTLDLAAKLTPGRGQIDLSNENDVDAMQRLYERYASKALRHEHVVLGDTVHVWRMPYFDLTASEIDRQFDKLGAAGTLILDLRANGGGREDGMLRLLGNLFDHDVVVGELRERKSSRQLIAKTRGHGRTFGGKLFVLVDSDSASASEVVARVVQLEHRGTIVGDRSSGSVMRAIGVEHQLGADVSIYWGMEVTIADLVHPDGKSLERVGVTPDVLLLPTQEDVAARRDPVLAQVAGMVGLSLDPVKAGGLFAPHN